MYLKESDRYRMLLAKKMPYQLGLDFIDQLLNLFEKNLNVFHSSFLNLYVFQPSTFAYSFITVSENVAVVTKAPIFPLITSKLKLSVLLMRPTNISILRKNPMEMKNSYVPVDFLDTIARLLLFLCSFAVSLHLFAPAHLTDTEWRLSENKSTDWDLLHS